MDLLTALPDDIILLFLEAAKDSRGLGLTCTRVYRLYAGTPDAVVFGNYHSCHAAVVAPPKLCTMFTPATLYLAGNLPCLKELWRRSFHIKRHFISAVFDYPRQDWQLYERGGTEMAEWLWTVFADVLVVGGGYQSCPYIDSIIQAGHIQLLKKIYKVTGEHEIDTDIVEQIDDFAMFRLVYDNTTDDCRGTIVPAYSTPTSFITYISMHGEKLAGFKPLIYAGSIERIRALRLDDVLENYDELYAAAIPYVRRWLEDLPRGGLT